MALNINQQQLSTAQSFADSGDYKANTAFLLKCPASLHPD